jgi:hypothetical protein
LNIGPVTWCPHSGVRIAVIISHHRVIQNLAISGIIPICRLDKKNVHFPFFPRCIFCSRSEYFLKGLWSEKLASRTVRQDRTGRFSATKKYFDQLLRNSASPSKFLIMAPTTTSLTTKVETGSPYQLDPNQVSIYIITLNYGPSNPQIDPPSVHCSTQTYQSRIRTNPGVDDQEEPPDSQG